MELTDNQGETTRVIKEPTDAEVRQQAFAFLLDIFGQEDAERVERVFEYASWKIKDATHAEELVEHMKIKAFDRDNLRALIIFTAASIKDRQGHVDYSWFTDPAVTPFTVINDTNNRHLPLESQNEFNPEFLGKKSRILDIQHGDLLELYKEVPGSERMTLRSACTGIDSHGTLSFLWFRDEVASAALRRSGVQRRVSATITGQRSYVRVKPGPCSGYQRHPSA